MRALGAAVMAGLMSMGAAQAQTVLRAMPGVVVASDLDGPYDDLPPPRYPPPPYARAYPAPPPSPPPAYGPSAYGPTLPIHEIYRIVRGGGYSPLGAPQNRGNVVTITVLDEDGEDGRLVIDAYLGRILRFVPAYTQGSRFSPAMPVVYGPPPSTVSARASVPLPKSRVAATGSLPQNSATLGMAKPPAIPPAPTAALAAAPADPVIKPAVALQPTQPIPPALGLE